MVPSSFSWLGWFLNDLHGFEKNRSPRCLWSDAFTSCSLSRLCRCNGEISDVQRGRIFGNSHLISSEYPELLRSAVMCGVSKHFWNDHIWYRWPLTKRTTTCSFNDQSELLGSFVFGSWVAADRIRIQILWDGANHRESHDHDHITSGAIVFFYFIPFPMVVLYTFSCRMAFTGNRTDIHSEGKLATVTHEGSLCQRVWFSFGSKYVKVLQVPQTYIYIYIYIYIFIHT